MMRWPTSPRAQLSLIVITGYWGILGHAVFQCAGSDWGYAFVRRQDALSGNLALVAVTIVSLFATQGYHAATLAEGSGQTVPRSGLFNHFARLVFVLAVLGISYLTVDQYGIPVCERGPGMCANIAPSF